MEFNFNFTSLLTHPSLPAADSYCDSDGADSSQPPTILTRWTYGTLEKILRSSDKQLVNDVFGTAVNEMGKRSASAQQLKQVITTFSKFSGSNDRIYLHCTLPNVCNGLLRVGEKKLFIRDEIGNVKEITPSCVLDFYVHESKQRSGIGKQLFEFMLHSERAAYASKFGYDRPSPKLLAFLKKHYDLSSYVPQNNNFVVFRKYFTKEAHENPISSSGGASRGASQQTSSHLQQGGSRRGGSYDSDASYGSKTSQYGGAASRSNARNHNEDYASYSQPQSSPPAGQASFSRFDDSSPGDARRLQYEDEQKALSSSSAAAPAAYPYEHERGSSNEYDVNPTASSSSSFSNTYSGSSYGNRSEGSRLARAGSNMLSSTNLLQTQPPQRSPSSSAAAAFQSPFSPVNTTSSSASSVSPASVAAAAPSSSNYSRSTNQPQYSPSSQQKSSSQQPGDAYPFSRMTQYHQHNILTGYSADKGHSNFANKSQQPANFLPDGIPPPQGGSDPYGGPSSAAERQRYPRSGVQPKPFVDPTPHTMKQVDTRIDKLEAAIREKEAALSNVPRFAIPHHTPDERDSRWSKAAVYQRQVNGWAEPNAYTDPSNPQATGVTEKHAQYSNPALSYKIGGGQNPINHQPMHQSSNPTRSSPFAYGSRR